MSPKEKLMMEPLRINTLCSTQELKDLVTNRMEEYTMVITGNDEIDMPQERMSRLLDIARATSASMIYCNYTELTPEGETRNVPLIDYQWGAIRDNFNFGPVTLWRTYDLKDALWLLPKYNYAAFYGARLICAINRGIKHLPETLYTVKKGITDPNATMFDYVDPRNRAVQLEMEVTAVAYLRYIRAFLSREPESVDVNTGVFPVEASVIIPVRNRESTIADALRSALAQETSFPFNIIVVDNHSTDRTTEIIARFAAEDPRVIHIIPKQYDLGIGGCWETAVMNKNCGRFAVQLDSDDLYSGPDTLRRIVELFYAEKCAMVVGSYELTDFDGNSIPPGLIDHIEWSSGNGRNNLLRINGMGAPRAFYTPIIREIGVPNVSYGEDYALGLRISRQYRIGRIYESLYKCRRWEGNSDSNISLEKANANNYYKDWLRTQEVDARIRMNLRHTRF